MQCSNKTKKKEQKRTNSNNKIETKPKNQLQAKIHDSLRPDLPFLIWQHVSTHMDHLLGEILVSVTQRPK